LGTLLRMIGGLAFTQWESIDELEDVWAAAEKYDMPGPIATIAVSLAPSVFLEHPLRLYAVAARYGLEEAAKLASKLTLGLSIHDEEHMSILERVPTTYVLRLFRLHKKRKDEFQRLVNLDKSLGIANCLKCGDTGLRGTASVALAMVINMDLHPVGNELLDGTWRTWPEAADRACTGYHCGYPITQYQDTITTTITNFIKSLPDTI